MRWELRPGGRVKSGIKMNDARWYKILFFRHLKPWGCAKSRAKTSVCLDWHAMFGFSRCNLPKVLNFREVLD